MLLGTFGPQNGWSQQEREISELRKELQKLTAQIHAAYQAAIHQSNSLPAEKKREYKELWDNYQTETNQRCQSADQILSRITSPGHNSTQDADRRAEGIRELKTRLKELRDFHATCLRILSDKYRRWQGESSP